MRELVELLARALVDEPDQVEVRELPQDEGILLELRVAPEDVGKVIGRQGRTIKAMRTLVHAAAIKSQARVSLELAEEHNRDRGPREEEG